jgi:hypothetical protein
MATLNIEGRKVTVDDSFLKLSPEQQNSTVDEIAKSFPKNEVSAPQPKLSDAITDIPHEISNDFSGGIEKVKALSGRGAMGPIDGLMALPRAVGGAMQAAFSPLSGAAKSIGGHLMAQGEHAVGTLIAPEIAAKDDPQKMYETAKGDVDLAMSAMAAKRPAGPPKLTPRAPTIAELDESATKGYESPEVKSLEVKPTVIKNFGTAAEQSLTNSGFDPEVAPKTYALLRKLQTVPDQSVVTGDNINTLRELFGKAAKSPDGTEAAAAARVIDHLDEALTKVPQSEVVAGDLPTAASRLEQARGDYAAARQSENIDDKLVSAELRAASTNSGQNVANTIRQRMAAVVDPTKTKEVIGLRPDEIDAAEAIARGTKPQNALRAAGNYLRTLHGGTIGATIGAAIGGAPGAAIGATAVPGLGAILKGVSNKMTIKQAQRLSEMIRSRAPLASSAQKFEEKASAFDSARSPQALSGMVLAARNLATNMRSAGINVSVSDLVSGFQSPSSGNAQQQDVPRPPGQ